MFVARLRFPPSCRKATCSDPENNIGALVYSISIPLSHSVRLLRRHMARSARSPLCIPSGFLVENLSPTARRNLSRDLCMTEINHGMYIVCRPPACSATSTGETKWLEKGLIRAKTALYRGFRTLYRHAGYPRRALENLAQQGLISRESCWRPRCTKFND